VYSAYSAPEVSEINVRLERLPRALDGLRIVQLTDVHIGDILQRPFLEDIVARANRLRPDLVAITGDLVDGRVSHLAAAVSALSALQSRFGTFFVTGNHDYYSGEVAWCEALVKMGVTPLRNRCVTIGEPGAALDLLVVDDWNGRRSGRPGYDLHAALAGRTPERASVLLAHQPQNFDAVAAASVDLQLSGHLHGGQLFPMSAIISAVFPHSRGLYRSGSSHIYVSRGIGFWGPPMRIGSAPELTAVTLSC
jgi:predicted MPP superfamily phosphohydrolase